MNEYGVDSLQLSAGQLITQAQIDLIEYLILKAGVYSSVPSDVNTPGFFNQTFTTFQYVVPSIQLMKQNNKPTGVYFFSYAWSAAAAQYEATLACDALDQWAEKPDFPIFLDWEKTGNTSPPSAMGAYEALIAAGITPTTQIVQDVTDAWMNTLLARGYVPGLYTGGALAGDLFTDAFLQNRRAQGLYFWEAAYNNYGPMHSCDIWQYSDNGNLLGVTVDENRIRDDRIWDIPHPQHGIPIWLKLYIAQRGEKNYGRTILL